MGVLRTFLAECAVHGMYTQLGDGMQVKDFARVADSIIGWGSSVGRVGEN